MSRPASPRPPDASRVIGLAVRSARALALAAVSALALAAGLTGVPSPALAGPAGYEITCFSASDCARLDPVAMPGGGDFAFAFGVKAFDDGLVLDVKTPNSIYVLGDLVTDGGTITLRAETAYVLDGTNIRNDIGPIVPPVVPPIVPGVHPGDGGVVICACVTVLSLPELPDLPRLEVGEGGDIDLRAQDHAVLEGLAFPPPEPKQPGDAKRGAILIDRDGDIHIDASSVAWFERIDLEAGEKLVIDGGGGKVPIVPEPGTAMLLGLGLAAMAAGRRTRHRTR